ncbi:hypothetical protein L2E82_15875 [Cichorium intybus]|uniref:Uncharacterized protein n=1 Tax=Cichorium intybus TaxID=13427 RepID=A0ACB9F4J9_CICIN|nr:hypothetical protein L2E82_15875 [Cichorium intybus]
MTHELTIANTEGRNHEGTNKGHIVPTSDFIPTSRLFQYDVLDRGSIFLMFYFPVSVLVLDKLSNKTNYASCINCGNGSYRDHDCTDHNCFPIGLSF